MSPLNYFQPQAVLSPCSPQSTQLLTSSPGKPLERRKQLRLSTSIWWEFCNYFSLLLIKLENNGSTAQCLTLCLKVEGTVYSLALIGHTYDTLSGATINTEAIENQETYIVKEGDHTANILVSFNLTSIQYLVFSITMVSCRSWTSTPPTASSTPSTNSFESRNTRNEPARSYQSNKLMCKWKF